MSGARVSFPQFSVEQLNSIAGGTPPPDTEEAMEQFREEYGDEDSGVSQFRKRHTEMCKAWEAFLLFRSQEAIEAFWRAQSQCEALVEGGLAGSARGLTPGEARRVLMTPKAREGLRELEARERELILQFRMR
jgi:hypothetical protein